MRDCTPLSNYGDFKIQTSCLDDVRWVFEFFFIRVFFIRGGSLSWGKDTDRTNRLSVEWTIQYSSFWARISICPLFQAMLTYSSMLLYNNFSKKIEYNIEYIFFYNASESKLRKNIYHYSFTDTSRICHFFFASKCFTLSISQFRCCFYICTHLIHHDPVKVFVSRLKPA